MRNNTLCQSLPARQRPLCKKSPCSTKNKFYCMKNNLSYEIRTIYEKILLNKKPLGYKNYFGIQNNGTFKVKNYFFVFKNVSLFFFPHKERFCIRKIDLLA